MSSEIVEKTLNDLVETLAAIEHERWSHWQHYMHDKCILQDRSGALLIPAELVQKWEQQARTPYANLSESEKESDRQQVHRYLPLIAQAFREKLDVKPK